MFINQNKTIEQALLNKNNSFDIIRLAASIGVLVWHSYYLLGRYIEDPFYRLSNTFHTGSFSVYIFFILSGFLIALSWEHHPRVAAFLGKRILRILPTLIVSVLLTLFILGPIYTTFTTIEYFRNPNTWLYLNNISLFDRNGTLPGVFVNNPNSGIINGSAWSLPYEFTLYLWIAIIGALSLISNIKRHTILVFLILVSLFYVFIGQKVPATANIEIFHMNVNFFLQHSIYFMLGTIFYLYKDKIRLNWIVALCSIVVLALTFKFHEYYFPFGVIALTYIVVYLAFISFKKPLFTSKIGDLSYGIYIYSYPIQQILIYHLPDISVYKFIGVSFIFSVLAGIASWWLIEKPFIGLKKYFDTSRYPIFKKTS
jgi:peptidoglycan/LPS O-acetylase OafA/YrhL